MVIGIGTDIIEIHRIAKTIDQTPLFLNKIFTEEERVLWEERHCKIEVLAGNFATKEAVSKALGTGFREFSPQHIEVLRDALGQPTVKLYGPAEKLAQEKGVQKIHVSISHCKTHATSMVVLEGGC